jgi:hypothetical protein
VFDFQDLFLSEPLTLHSRHFRLLFAQCGTTSHRFIKPEKYFVLIDDLNPAIKDWRDGFPCLDVFAHHIA